MNHSTDSIIFLSLIATLAMITLYFLCSYLYHRKETKRKQKEAEALADSLARLARRRGDL